MRGVATKRSLPLEPSGDGHVSKRLRDSRVTGTAGLLLRTTSGRDSHSTHSTDDEDDSSEATSPGDESGSDIEGGSSTSSSGSESTDPSESLSEDDDIEIRSPVSLSTSSPPRNNPSEQAKDIPNLPRPPPKPSISASSHASALQSRLSAFLPELQRANADLEEDPVAARTQRLDQVGDDEEHYIEMNLGLGVLKEMAGRARADGIRLTDDQDASSDAGEGFDSDDTGDAEQASELQFDTTRLRDLMGDKPQATRETPNIQEVPGS